MADEKKDVKEAPKPCDGQDRISVGPCMGTGIHPYIRHRPDHTVEHGVILPAKEGQPIPPGAGLVHITRREGEPFLRAETLYDAPAGSAPAVPKSGPAMVNSTQYQAGWDRIFGKKAEVGQA
jgi:hypothetical protein